MIAETRIEVFEQLVPEDAVLQVQHDPGDHVVVLAANPSGPDTLYRYLVVGRRSTADSYDDAENENAENDGNGDRG